MVGVCGGDGTDIFLGTIQLWWLHQKGSGNESGCRCRRLRFQHFAVVLCENSACNRARSGHRGFVRPIGRSNPVCIIAVLLHNRPVRCSVRLIGFGACVSRRVDGQINV